jgi:signal transduction histidine kinase
MLPHSISPDAMSLWFPLAVIVFIEGLAIHTWQYRRESGALWQCGLQASKGLWLLALLINNRCTSIEQTIISQQAATALSLLAAYLWFRFVTRISGSDRSMPRNALRAFDGGLSIGCILSLTNNWHEWLWHSVRLAGGRVEAQTAPAGFVVVLAVYVLSAFTIVINVRWAMRNVGLRRRQAWMFLLPSLVSWTGYCLSSVFEQESFALRTISFFLTSLLMIWAFHRWRLYSILPLAKEVVLDGMVDGLMVVDEEGYIVDLNAPARDIFAASNISMGGTIADAQRAWPEMVCGKDSASVWEAQRKQDEAVFFYQITQTPLRTPAGHLLGEVLVFKDITRDKQQQARIVEQERALAMMTERERLGRELHDGQGQVWGYLSLTTQMLRTLLARQKYAQADQELTRLHQLVQEMNTGFRESVHGLHASVAAGLIPALERQLDWYRQHCGFEIELSVQCDWRQGMLTPEAEAHLLRIVQESMVNIRKSAQASRVRVALARVDRELHVQVEDNGRGFDVAGTQASAGHQGLKIMRERAEEMGGRLEVESQPGHGTKVRLMAPLAGEGWENALS